jgi:hypothetical protein
MRADTSPLELPDPTADDAFRASAIVGEPALAEEDDIDPGDPALADYVRA